jgi:hypothetical protein
MVQGRFGAPECQSLTSHGAKRRGACGPVVVTTSAPNENDHRDRREAAPTLSEIKSVLASDKDFLKPIVRAVLQEVLEGEMTEAHGAAEGEREGDLASGRGTTRAP